MRGVWAELQNAALERAGEVERVDHRSLEAQREGALRRGDELKAEGLDREPELKLGPAANAIERREQRVAAAEGREYEPLTQRGARVHAVRQAKALFAEMRERLELAREAYGAARDEGLGHVSAGLAALRAAAGRQGLGSRQGDIAERLAGITGRDAGERGADIADRAGRDIRERLSEALGRATPVAQEEVGTEKDLGRDRVRERDDDSGWGL